MHVYTLPAFLSIALVMGGCTGNGDGDKAIDHDGDGYAGAQDCDDTDPTVNPAAAEQCDEADLDEDCDGGADDDDPNGAVGEIDYYADADGDGYAGSSSASVSACDAPAGYAAEVDDCDDADPGVNPGAAEICDAGRTDEDCDGLADDDDPGLTGTETWYPDADEDGYGDEASGAPACDPPAPRPRSSTRRPWPPATPTETGRTTWLWATATARSSTAARCTC